MHGLGERGSTPSSRGISCQAHSWVQRSAGWMRVTPLSCCNPDRPGTATRARSWCRPAGGRRRTSAQSQRAQWPRRGAGPPPAGSAPGAGPLLRRRAARWPRQAGPPGTTRRPPDAVARAACCSGTLGCEASKPVRLTSASRMRRRRVLRTLSSERRSSSRTHASGLRSAC